MSKVPSLNCDQVVRALRRDGWVIVRQRGSHIRLHKHQDGLGPRRTLGPKTTRWLHDCSKIGGNLMGVRRKRAETGCAEETIVSAGMGDQAFSVFVEDGS